jgi:acyl-CoA reductase-like NAD-dependent aldehyde dehydrogenase
MADHKISFDTYHNVIANELTTTSKTRRAICPSTEEPLWEVPVSTQDDVDRAVAAAKSAYPAWRKLSQDERAGYLVKLAEAIMANKQEFIDLLGREAGKPPQAGAFELLLVNEHVTTVPKLRLPEEVPEDTEDRTAIVRWVPLGVGVAIVPWNFPLLLGIGKLFPALLAGNTFIWKPSPFSPYTGLKVAELAARIFPPGVVQALSGEEDLGPMFTSHPDVAKISFTGSTATGKKVMAACAATLKRFTLEMGGNDAAIICEDVDIDKAVQKVGFLALVHNGQICMDVKRIYVHESIYDQFLPKLVEFVKQLKSGTYADAEAFFGPVQNSMQYRKLQDLYSQISKQGWKTAIGGKVHDADDSNKEKKGYFVDPTIIDNPPEDSRIVVEEPFGPIVPVLKWSDEDDVIRRANDSDMGLGASVWSKDVPRAKRMAEQLEAGSVWVNTHFELGAHVPFGGHKQSGFGMEWGITGLKGWCNPQAVWVKHSGA